MTNDRNRNWCVTVLKRILMLFMFKPLSGREELEMHEANLNHFDMEFPFGSIIVDKLIRKTINSL